jgi:hypothetical protein
MPNSQAQAAAGTEDSERRIEQRLDFIGTDIGLLFDGTRYTLRLKDLSSFGLCGLTDAPLAQGQMTCLLLPDCEPIAAEIRWVRKTLIGAAFPTPLAADLVLRLQREHVRQVRGRAAIL